MSHLSTLVHRLLRHACLRRRTSVMCLVVALPCLCLLLNLDIFSSHPNIIHPDMRPVVTLNSHRISNTFQTTSLTQMKDQWRQPVPLSPLLEQLVIKGQHLTASDPAFFSSSSSAHNCSGLLAANVNRKLPTDHVVFQKMVPNSESVYLFSAYFDRRWRPTPTVVVIGLSELSVISPKYCQIWYRNDVTEEPHVTLAQTRSSFESHGRRYTTSLYKCHVRNNDVIPYAVSLVTNPCDPAPINLLKVMTSSDNYVIAANFTGCVTPLNFAYDNVRQLVETIEVNRMFGAGHFIFYNHTSGPHVKVYLDFYRKWLNAVTVVPWRLPMPTDVWPHDPNITPEVHYFAQGAALTDCLFRNMVVLRSPFVVFTDLDEIIVPRRHNTWAAMLDDVTSAWFKSQAPGKFPGSYVVHSTFFRTDWTRDRKFVDQGAAFQNLDTLSVTERELKVFEFSSRSKYIALSSANYQPGVHAIENVLQSRDVVKAVMVDEQMALVHHYRLWFDNPTPARLIDRHMHCYVFIIAQRTSAVHDLVGFTAAGQGQSVPFENGIPASIYPNSGQAKKTASSVKDAVTVLPPYPRRPVSAQHYIPIPLPIPSRTILWRD